MPAALIASMIKVATQAANGCASDPAQVLRSLGLSKIRILSNNAVRLKAIHGFGLDIVDVVPIP